MNSRKTPTPQFNTGTSANKQQNAWGQTWKQKQETPKLPCDICGFTTTQHNNQHKTYRPPSTKHQPSPTTTNTTITTHHCHQAHQPNQAHQPSQAQPSRAPAFIASRPRAWLRSFWLHLGNIASQPADSSQQLTGSGQRAAGKPVSR